MRRRRSIDNEFEATVPELIYLGDHIRTRLALLGREYFIVKVPKSADPVAMREGDTVAVGWQGIGLKFRQHSGFANY